jgi:two-component system, LytTR family, response regulator LytT
MKVLIIEDESPAAARLQSLLHDVDPAIEVAEVLDSVELAVQHLKVASDYDVIFMDIHLADGRSFAIFDAVEVKIPVVFTTAYDQYAMQAFDVNGIDYLLKPVHKNRLVQALEKLKDIETHFAKNHPAIAIDKLMNYIAQTSEKAYKTRFLVTKGESLLPINIEQVAYFFAQDKFVFLVTDDKQQHILNASLDELAAKLNPKQFFRANRQFIVSLKSVKKVHYYFNYKLKIELTPPCTDEVLVSRARISDFKLWLEGEMA